MELVYLQTDRKIYKEIAGCHRKNYMITSIVSTLVFLVFILLIHRGEYPARPNSTVKPLQELVEIGILAGCLLLVPFSNFSLFWYSDWLSAYLVFGILAPVIMEFVVRKRSLAFIGFRMPSNRRVLSFVAAIIGLYILSKLVYPLATGAESIFTWKRFISNSIIFAFLEEIIFRGLIQTRLEAILGTTWSWILSGLFFGFYHYYHDYLITGKIVTTENIFQLIYLSLFGILLGVIFAKTRSLLPSYLVHAMNNLPLFTL
jgi:membrane protease YdiL (CAAX protease family)